MRGWRLCLSYSSPGSSGIDSAKRDWTTAEVSIGEATMLLAKHMVEIDRRDERVAELTGSTLRRLDACSNTAARAVKLAAASLLVAVAALAVAVVAVAA